MLERYNRVACDDLPYIQQLLKDDPQAIDASCTLEDSNAINNAIWADFLKKTGVVGILSASALAFTGPIGWAFVAATYAQTARVGYSAFSPTQALRSRVNWNLLDFSAEHGAIKVAMYAILKGANTSNNYFLDLAKENGHETYYQICSMLILAKKQLESTKKQLDVATSEIMRLQNNSDELNKTIELLQRQNESALDEIRKHVAEIDKQTALAIEWETLFKLSTDDPSPLQNVASQKAPDLSPKPVAAQKPIVKSPTVATTNGFFSPSKYVHAYGLLEDRVQYVRGDCFYYAAVAVRKDRRWSVQQLRKNVYNELKNSDSNDDVRNYEVVLLWTKNGIKIETSFDPKTRESKYEYFPNYEAYCQYITKDQICADENVIRAFVNTEQVGCLVLDTFNNTKTLHGSKYINDTNPPIFLGFEENNHYYPLKCPPGKRWQDIIEEVKRDPTYRLAAVCKI